MKKYLIFSLLSLIFTLSLHAEAVKKLKPNVNPINIAIAIVEKEDSAKIADLFDYNGYTYQGTEDGYNVMKDHNGNVILYSFQNSNTGPNYPKVIVKSKEKIKDIEKRLDNLMFKKVGKLYERKVNYDKNYSTKCTMQSNNSLVFQRSPR